MYYVLVVNWVSDCCSAIFQLFYGENKLIFIEMMIRSTLY